ncbi:hypothetical protein GMORB2_3489 [Geosmithia morbida]|uniref:DNA-directed RNA polymerase subunit n=1 Tax=Geosmithia morbida TaxID=1094350 RepID=A0A9P5CY74_9HYPO|nr:uncharacterized protein GMORB2_3489 [Geosmithia morbida]KAF4120078.1 hypothetical protein GMORB2_3489 [Geosmithia morbida]
MAPINSTEPVREKHSKKEKKDKKRARDEEAAADVEHRKHKKSKSEAGTVTGGEQDEAKALRKSKKSKKIRDNNGSDGEAAEKKDKKKSKKSKKEEDIEDATANLKQDAAKESSPQKKSKSGKKSAKAEPNPKAEEEQAVDAMDIDDTTTSTFKTTSGKIHQPSDTPSTPQFPFFHQTISLYEPIYPNGWAKPITGCESQHLRHLRDRYVPSMRGVLLDYEKVTLGQKPGRAGAAADDESPAMVRSRAEFGGAFGWITADVKLFVPSRGAWMEGVINLQTEGHIGVVCFGKFNASIEARRLPASWRWVPNDDDSAAAPDDGASVFTGADEHGVVRQIHSTGYWVDADGEKARGRVRFRIRNFDVGVSGDSTYLSLQGTMLNKLDEGKLVATEAREAQERKARKGGRWRERRVVPDFSMTRFATADEDEEPQATEPQLQQVSEEVMAAEVGIV